MPNDIPITQERSKLLFADIRLEIASTPRWTRDLIDKAIRFPESLTFDERLELAADTGARRLVLRKQAEMALANAKR